MRLLSHGHRWLRAAGGLIQGVPQHASQRGPDLPSLAYRLWDQGRLLLVSGITPTNYYRYRLFRPERSNDEKALFLGYFDGWRWLRSEEPPSELPSLMRTSSAVFCLTK